VDIGRQADAVARPDHDVALDQDAGDGAGDQPGRRAAGRIAAHPALSRFGLTAGLVPGPAPQILLAVLLRGGISATPSRLFRQDRARSSAGEHYVDIVGVTGSIPVA